MRGENDHPATPFFADMTLDLAEAHDIAETPEPTRLVLLETPTLRPFPPMPSMTDGGGGGPWNGQGEGRGESEGGTTSLQSKARPLAETRPLSLPGPSGSSPDPQPNCNPQDDSHTHPMARVTASDRSRPLSGGVGTRLRQRRWPRDVAWATAFCVVVPASLLLPLWFGRGAGPAPGLWLATAASPRLATLHTLLWGLAAALGLSRLLYRTMGGGDGDDARHLASQLLLAAAPVSVSVYLLLVAAVLVLTPNARAYSAIPLWYLARDLYLFRRWRMTATTPGGRQAFFQALTCATLDILSRALRRQVFFRAVASAVVAQFLLILWWRAALLAALRSGSVLWVVLAAAGGKWATGTVARLLGLVACGGVSAWFAEQSSLVSDLRLLERRQQQDQEQQQQQQQQQQRERQQKPPNVYDRDEEMIEFSTVSPTSQSPQQHPSLQRTNYDKDDSMPEAYRTVDASAYKSVFLQDEGMDDDFDDEEEDDDDDAAIYTSQREGRRTFFGSRRYSAQDRTIMSSTTTTSQQQRSTVKQLLLAGVTVSFGSVAKCGLLGGLAQFLWSQIRKIDHARATFGGLRGMSIGGGPEADRDGPREGFLSRILLRINATARDFVRTHSDMAMSYVAAYQTSYTRSAQDVALLVDESGVEPIIHDDISTHMSACVGGSVSGLIVIFTGAVLVHQRNKNSPGVPDSAVVLDMLLAFYFCYTLIFTVMEPLRASIKAVYVCFAQHPESLSQAFPLIYHRLTRMSQSNLH